MSFFELVEELSECEVFHVIDDTFPNPLEYQVDPLNFDYIPKWNSKFIVKAHYIISEKSIKPCYLVIVMPERVVENVILENEGKFSLVDVPYDYEELIIPSVPSEVAGNHELYYAEENPKVGLEILEKAYQKYPDFKGVLDDLAYIYRDEEDFDKSLKYFLALNETTPNQNHILIEIAELYENLKQKEEAKSYWRKAIQVLEEEIINKGANQYHYQQLVDMYRKVGDEVKAELYEGLKKKLLDK